MLSLTNPTRLPSDLRVNQAAGDGDFDRVKFFMDRSDQVIQDEFGNTRKFLFSDSVNHHHGDSLECSHCDVFVV